MVINIMSKNDFLLWPNYSFAVTDITSNPTAGKVAFNETSFFCLNFVVLYTLSWDWMPASVFFFWGGGGDGG